MVLAAATGFTWDAIYDNNQRVRDLEAFTNDRLDDASKLTLEAEEDLKNLRDSTKPSQFERI